MSGYMHINIVNLQLIMIEDVEELDFQLLQLDFFFLIISSGGSP